MTIGQLYKYTTETVQSETVLLRAIDTQLTQIQVKILSMKTDREDAAALQTLLMYASMRIYRASPIASEPIDRISLRLMQVCTSHHTP
ncbi:hypothetical protein N0V88_005038 [Collariella sp. IMI 366227]|nr:hypothetical protein N0V88_005038 [Collariella sp. IMI 366227]